MGGAFYKNSKWPLFKSSSRKNEVGRKAGQCLVIDIAMLNSSPPSGGLQLLRS